MTQSRKPLALFLVILLALSTVALSSSTNAEETSARVTNNEEIVVSVNDIYYDRGGDITFTVTSTNLDPATEYTIDWNLCNYGWNGCSGSGGFTSTSGTYGSATFTATSNGPHTETITFTDPGYFTEDYDPVTGSWSTSGVYNNSYSFHAELHVQGVELDTNASDPFIYGGEIVQGSSYISTVDNILKTMNVSFEGRIQMDHNNYFVIDYTTTCNLYESGATSPVDSIVRISNVSDGSNGLYDTAWNSNTNSYDALTPTASSGPHYVECDFTRNVDNAYLGTVTSNVFQVIDDTSNQDDATIVVGATMNLQEAWGTVTIDAIDLDAGQEYTLDWVVEDYSLSTPTVMMQNDHIWVAGNDGTYTYELEFHDLADTTDACITVVFTAGDDELQVVDNVCWASASTADGDGDGVYDKNDLCPDTSAGLAVTADGCSDSDNDGFDTDLEIDCNTDPNDALSFPTDLDNDGTCDYLDTDTDGDGYLDVDELAAGTDPFDPLSKPANRLPECAVYYNLEIDGIPTSFDGEAAIPALSGVTATAAASSLTPTTVTIPAGSYYITAHCIDPDGDDVTVTVNEITVGPVAGEVSGAVLIEIGEDVDETMDVQITWSDGTDSLTALVTVELDGGSPGLIPGFGTALTIMALLGAGFVLTRKDD
ncbi:MAG: PGF-CTERM sorting domain-containing protein [Candidatus Poseidoniaceae archaeon]